MVLFEPVLRWALGRVKAESGIEMTFHSASGSLWAGRFSFSGVQIRRAGDPSANYDLTVGELSLDVDMGTVLSSPLRIESLRAAKVSGTLERIAPPSADRLRRPFVIDRLVIEEADLLVRDRLEAGRWMEVPLKVTRLESSPFESVHPVLSVFFRSNASGTLDGAPFVLETSGTDGGRTTRWKAEGVPLRMLGDVAGGPFGWIREGGVDLDVRDRWRLANGPVEIDMQWKIVLRDVKAEVPDDASVFTSTIAEPVVKYLNAHAAELPVEFGLVMNESAFHGHWSLGAAGLWEATAAGAVRAVAELAGVKAETLRQWGSEGLEAFKGFLDRSRKRSKP